MATFDHLGDQWSGHKWSNMVFIKILHVIYHSKAHDEYISKIYILTTFNHLGDQWSGHKWSNMVFIKMLHVIYLPNALGA